MIELCSTEPSNEICPDGTLHLVPLAEQINAVSSQLALYSGVTDQNSFDLSPTVFNPNALNYNGITIPLTVYFGDQFNQFNSDGVEATVLTESGVIGPQNREAVCRTNNALCEIMALAKVKDLFMIINGAIALVKSTATLQRERF